MSWINHYETQKEKKESTQKSKLYKFMVKWHVIAKPPDVHACNSYCKWKIAGWSSRPPLVKGYQSSNVDNINGYSGAQLKRFSTKESLRNHMPTSHTSGTSHGGSQTSSAPQGGSKTSSAPQGAPRPQILNMEAQKLWSVEIDRKTNSADLCWRKCRTPGEIWCKSWIGYVLWKRW